jgi:hypothetical protein
VWNVPLINNYGGCVIMKTIQFLSYRGLVDRVIDFVEDYDAHIKEFEGFRRYIVEEPELFVKDVGCW